MNFKLWIASLLFLGFGISQVNGQCSVRFGGPSDLINEIGVVAGPVIFKSDYLADSQLDFNNIGIGVGLVHYLNFSRGAENYFNDHFKVRNELSYQVTSLHHHGSKVEESSESKKLELMHGKSKNLELGSNLEWYPLGISRFQDNPGSFTPYLSAGVHLVHYMPEVYSDLNKDKFVENDIVNRNITPEKFYETYTDSKDEKGYKSYVNTGSGNTISFSASIGVRYKLTQRSDLQLDVRGVYYGSDKVDGLNVDDSYNDAIGWVTLGYIYYLGF